jgi:hypothetical protein
MGSMNPFQEMQGSVEQCGWICQDGVTLDLRGEGFGSGTGHT